MLFSDGLQRTQKNMFNLFSSGQFYENDFLEHIRSLNLDGVYLDVGANVGNHSVYFSLFTHADKVIAFEPLPRFLAFLCEHLTLNKVLHKCEIKPFGLSDISDYVDIVFFGTVTRSYVTTLDALDLQDRISLIKIDVEGMEMAALRGGVETLKRNSPIIFAEAHSSDELANIMRVVSPLGYRTTGRVFNATPTYEIRRG